MNQLTAVPIPSPASGFLYTFDQSLGVYSRSGQSFGPIFAERAETIGKDKFLAGVRYQHLHRRLSARHRWVQQTFAGSGTARGPIIGDTRSRRALLSRATSSKKVISRIGRGADAPDRSVAHDLHSRARRSFRSWLSYTF